MGGFGTTKAALPRSIVSETPRLALKSLPSVGQTINLSWGDPENPAAALFVKVTRSADRLTIETDGSAIVIALRFWAMPRQRGRLHGVRTRMVCRCGASRDALHWTAEGGWGCRGCLAIGYPSRHQQR